MLVDTFVFPPLLWRCKVVRVSHKAICLEGHMFGGPLFIFSDLPPFLATMTSFPRIHMYTGWN